MSQNMSTPAESLSGHHLEGGWEVGEIIENHPEESGGYFSICYNVSKPSGELGFLKALDFSGALSSQDLVKALQICTDAYLHEKALLEMCRSLSRVVTALDFGTVTLGDPKKAEIVPYIIFEVAEATVRAKINRRLQLPFEWKVRSLHQATVGMRQLHAQQISHQDVKPSNALLFGDRGLKLADLGRSVSRGRNVHHASQNWPGDIAYAPPEIAYGYLHPEFNVRRFSSDIYLIGSFAVSLLTGMHMTTWIKEEVPDDLRSPIWGGKYSGTYQQVIAHIENAHATAIQKIFEAVGVQEQFIDELKESIRELCQPDPEKRGHPRTHAIKGDTGNRFDLERYISRFDKLTFRAKIYDRSVSQQQ